MSSKDAQPQAAPEKTLIIDPVRQLGARQLGHMVSSYIARQELLVDETKQTPIGLEGAIEVQELLFTLSGIKRSENGGLYSDSPHNELGEEDVRRLALMHEETAYQDAYTAHKKHELLILLLKLGQKTMFKIPQPNYIGMPIIRRCK